MKTKLKKIWTYKDFLDGKLKEWEEIVSGKKIKKMSAYERHGALIGEIVFCLQPLSKRYKILIGEVGIKINELTIRAADIVVVKRELYRGSREAIDYEVELIIEIEEYRKSYVRKKIEDYLKFGIRRQIWIFLDREEIWDIDNLGNKKILSFDDEIDIFGAKLKIRDLV
jgi:hypothetical protein